MFAVEANHIFGSLPPMDVHTPESRSPHAVRHLGVIHQLAGFLPTEWTSMRTYFPSANAEDSVWMMVEDGNENYEMTMDGADLISWKNKDVVNDAVTDRINGDYMNKVAV
ncbi:hypothetical protein BC938DRAFT_481161 [Jimgerdemannia flammicorona]|uniref:Uncharacterized protein n=1 Tax=Jimgerdemannia flammicorona TaxID=994334 RepID=A0A433QGQ2_9FUNG|nr:hypothetical protein BC938DRAFT_481161 [Jimgerdemannia flammicorona]